MLSTTRKRGRQVYGFVDAARVILLAFFMLAGAAGPALALKTCMFTNSPDEHFILDTLPDFPQVSVAAGFSGHGFKHSSVVGEIMADLVQQASSRHDLGLFRMGRFQTE